jgi:hypothetical protein
MLITVLRSRISRHLRGRDHPTLEKVNHVSTKTAQTVPEVMLGTFNFHSTPATILFYSGASYTFISNIFVRMHSVPMLAMKEPLLVNSPRGTMQITNRCLPVSMVLRG